MITPRDINRYRQMEGYAERLGFFVSTSDPEWFQVYAIGDDRPTYSNTAHISRFDSFEELLAWLKGFNDAIDYYESIGFTPEIVDAAEQQVRNLDLLDVLKDEKL